MRPRLQSDACARPLNFTVDRKSTRLNSSHSQISYAVFCLKKKKEALCATAPKHEVVAGMCQEYLGVHALLPGVGDDPLPATGRVRVLNPVVWRASLQTSA